jgi:hypothetical protein
MHGAPVVDGLVSQVRIVSARHPLFGQTFPVIAERSSRGPRFLVVRLPDGRKRSLLRSITDLEGGAEPFPNGHDSVEESLRVSVRTLLPLAHFLASRSASVEGSGNDHASSSVAKGKEPDSTELDLGVETSSSVDGPLGDRAPPSGVDCRGHGQENGRARAEGAK